MSKTLTVSDIADLRACHRTTAWRRLSALREKYGDSVVWLEDGKLVTTTEALARVQADEPAPPDPRLLRRIEHLESEYEEQEKRIDGLSRELSEFRRKSAEWLKRGR